jgi:hypothetical protein
MENTDTKPYFIESGDDQSERLGEPLCILRERGEDDRQAFARIRLVIAAAVAEAEEKNTQGTAEQRQKNATQR